MDCVKDSLARRKRARLIHGAAVLLSVLAAGGCADRNDRVARAWTSADTVQYANTDSLSTARGPHGKLALFATAKEGGRLDIFDADSGTFLQSIGALGDAPGQFRRPNGILTVEFETPGGKRPIVIVVERDNRRVHAITPDSLKTVGLFGSDVLHKPYGCAVARSGEAWLLFVTDTEVDPAKTVHVFELHFDGTALGAKHLRAFGDVAGVGKFQQVESIVVDEKYGRVLVCDEPPKHVKVYDFDGKFLGRTFGDGLVGGDPEGIVIWERASGDVIILTDQRPEVSLWHCFDRESFKHIGTFQGDPTVANTDGICIHPQPFGRFEHGALFAVDRDLNVCAFDLRDVGRRIDTMRKRTR